MGVLCISEDRGDHQTSQPRYRDALYVCEYVKSRIFNGEGELVHHIPFNQRYRLQNLLYTLGSLQHAIHSPDSSSQTNAITSYFKALDVMLRPPLNKGADTHNYTSVDILVAVCIAGLLASAGPDTPLASEIARALGIADSSRFTANILEESFNILEAVHSAGPLLIETLLRLGGGILPMTLLLPPQVARLPPLLFSRFSGTLPGLSDHSQDSTCQNESENARRMTSAVLLTLARKFQRVSTISQVTLTIKGVCVRSSTSLVLLFYFLAMAIHPSPGTCNNMGILLSGISLSTSTIDINRQREIVNGQILANAYYRRGLAQDNSHPYLLTNLGSLLKEQGRIDEAIK